MILRAGHEAPSSPSDSSGAPDRPLRIFHLIKSLGRGGAEMLLPEGLRFADRERFTYGYGYFLPWKDAMVGSLREQGADVTCFSARSNAAILASTRRVAAHLEGWGADLVHCHMPMAGVVGRVAAKLAGIPVVYTEHNLFERFHPVSRRLNHLTWRWQEEVIAVSGDVAESIRTHAPASVPVKVVLNGIDVETFRRDGVDGGGVRAELGIPADVPVVGAVAVFREQKRLDDWLEAAHILRARIPATRFVLIGDGPLRAELEGRVRRLALEDAVHFPGLQEDVRPYLAAMDVYMISSLFEGLPLALLEAMSMECAVVSTAVGGIPEVIRDGRNGFLVETGRPQRLAGAVARLLESPDTARRCAAEARRTVQERFSMARMTRELESTYVDVLHRCGNGA